MMDPEASVSAIVFHHPDAVYFSARGVMSLVEFVISLADASSAAHESGRFERPRGR